jgi:anti-sigma regulatory factor (Ser/Thr protein kinase)
MTRAHSGVSQGSTQKDGQAVLTGTTTSDEEPQPGTGNSAPGRAAPQGAEPEHRVIARQFTSSPRGARLARGLAVHCLEEWGYPPSSDTSCTVALLVGELAANAVQHGSLPGRDFGLRIGLDEAAGLVRVEVADAASAKRPPASPPSSHPDRESGRGLLLVDVLAVRWGSAPRRPIGKTVWAEVAVEVPTPLF